MNQASGLVQGSDTALARTVFLGRLQTIYVSIPRAFATLSQLNQRNTLFTRDADDFDTPRVRRGQPLQLFVHHDKEEDDSHSRNNT